MSRNKFVVSILYVLTLIIMGYFIFPFWSVMLICWFGLAAFIYKTKFSRLSSKEQNYWLILIFAYPALETVLKGLIYFELIPYSYRPLNLMEHFLWATSMTLIIYPLLKTSLAKLNKSAGFLLILGIVVVIGNLNELTEYVLRYFMDLNTVSNMAAYYKDTTIDLVVNLTGSGIGALIIMLRIRPNSLENKEYSQFSIEN